MQGKEVGAAGGLNDECGVEPAEEVDGVKLWEWERGEPVGEWVECEFGESAGDSECADGEAGVVEVCIAFATAESAGVGLL